MWITKKQLDKILTEEKRQILNSVLIKDEIEKQLKAFKKEFGFDSGMYVDWPGEKYEKTWPGKKEIKAITDYLGLDWMVEEAKSEKIKLVKKCKLELSKSTEKEIKNCLKNLEDWNINII